MAERKICVVTGTRADYGLLYWLMKEIESDPALRLQLIVTGAHLEPRFGHTVDVIEADGFAIDARVPIDLSDDSPQGITAATGRALSGIGAAVESLAPEIIVLLGDRYEILAAATAAMLQRIPIAHLHGGEVTEGALDDSMRHAITKMSQWHFAAAEPYRQRIIQMGEAPERVFTVGAPGLDHLVRTPLMGTDEIKAELNINPAHPYFLITHHPTTLGDEDATQEIIALLAALDCFPEHSLVFTGVNADAGHDTIAQTIHEYVLHNNKRARLFSSLGQRRYLSAMQNAAAVIGNSSSGILEAPSCNVPTVNIGLRQKGRLRAETILDCDAVTSDIQRAILQATDPAFMASRSNAILPYGKPGASNRIKEILKACDASGLRRKVFYDLPSTRTTP